MSKKGTVLIRNNGDLSAHIHTSHSAHSILSRGCGVRDGKQRMSLEELVQEAVDHDDARMNRRPSTPSPSRGLGNISKRPESAV